MTAEERDEMFSFVTSKGSPAAPASSAAPKNAGGWKFLGKTTTPKKKTEIRVPLLGLDCSGKTTMLYKLLLGDIVTTIPTSGFNAETYETDNEIFKIWDLGGASRVRALWRHYLENTSILAFAVDSSPEGRVRLPEAKEALRDILQKAGPEAAVTPLLILATKQEIPGAMSGEEVSLGLELDTLARGFEGPVRRCILQMCSNGGGLREGLAQAMHVTVD
jgi:ADP-ribosylation factor protein 1